MTTTIDERVAPTQFDRGTSDADALSKRVSWRTLGIALLGVASLFVFTVVLTAVRISYRPYRGC